MAKSVAGVEGHYEVREAPFSRRHDWHPACVDLECDRGEKLTLCAASTIPTCWCGMDYSAVIWDIQGREGRLRREVAHPWQHDTLERAEQYLLNEAAYTEGSP